MTQTPKNDKGYSIYGLEHPISKVFCYIGLSENPEKRFGQHLRKSPPWITELRQQDLLPNLIIIEASIEGISKAREREKHWIKWYGDQGHPLENYYHNEEVLQRRDEEAWWKEKEAKALAHLTPEQRQRLDELNAEGYARFGNDYQQVFWDMWQTANGPYQIDADKHRIELAEIALKFCAIPSRRQEEGGEA